MSVLTDVQLLWGKREYEKAAAALAGWPYPLNAASWRWDIAPRFAESFKDDSRGAVEAAASIIRTDKVPPEMVYCLAFEIGLTSPKTAFEILSRIRVGGLRRLEVLSLAYRYLKQATEADTPHEASDWIRQQLSEPEKTPLCIFAYKDKSDELLWDVAPRELHGEEGDCYWLLRAAGSLRREINSSQTSLLNQHFSAAGGSHYHTFGRYLLDLESQAAVLAAATDQKKQCEAFYYLGFKEQMAGRYSQAADYYLQCLDTGLYQVTEYRWAHDQLFLWQMYWKSLARQAREHDSRKAL